MERKDHRSVRMLDAHDGTIFGLGVLFLVLGILCALDLIPVNDVAGLRTSTTKQSPDAWYAAHRAAAPFFLGVGVLGVLAGPAMACAVRRLPSREHRQRARRRALCLFVIVLIGATVAAGVVGEKEAASSRHSSGRETFLVSREWRDV